MLVAPNALAGHFDIQYHPRSGRKRTQTGKPGASQERELACGRTGPSRHADSRNTLPIRLARHYADFWTVLFPPTELVADGASCSHRRMFSRDLSRSRYGYGRVATNLYRQSRGLTLPDEATARLLELCPSLRLRW